VTDRLDLTLRLVRGAGEITLAELVDRLSVSMMTVRRDLDELQRQGFVRRVRGGAVSLVAQPEEAGFAARERWQHKTKARLGAAAAGLIAPNSTVLLDAGTTTAATAPQLKAPLTVAALSLQAANRLADKPGIRLLVIGGESRPGERSLVGHLALRMLDELWFDTFIMSIGAVHPRLGWSEFATEDASVKQRALQRAERTIVVADSTKLGVLAFTKVADLGSVDTFVTDSEAEGETLDAIREAGVEVVLT
jgi:DeoR/GlpR family transcriptional regulator of sugar metabolism